MGQIKKLMEMAFDNTDTLDEAAEQLLDMLEAEWLARQRGEELEDYDYYSIGKDINVEEKIHGARGRHSLH